MKFIKDKCVGNIFLIPLYLPEYQLWRNSEDLINYGKYQFHMEDIYAFGRVIDAYAGGGDLIEVFRYVGEIPNTSTVITSSGRLFEPVHIMMAFSKKRYPFIFSDNKYDKYIASDYQNISFLLMTEIWKGGEITAITQDEKKKLELDKVPWWVVYTGTQLEERIRSHLENMGVVLNYDQIVEQRKEEFPVPKITAVALRKKLMPFLWNDDGEEISFSLDTGSFKHDCFVDQGLLGNGYEWENLFLKFVHQIMPELLENITCDSEAGTFSIISSDKKQVQVMALAFRSFCENEANFKIALSELK